MDQWQSWSHFWHMDGYGLYIWGSYAVTLVCMAIDPLTARSRRKRALQAARDVDAQ